MDDTRFVDYRILRKFMRDSFVKIGVPPEDADTCSDILIEADLRGIDSHGIGRFKTIYYDRIISKIVNPITTIDVIEDKKAIAVLDGNNGMGHVIGKKAMEMAINKGKEYGIGMVVVRSSSHYGIAGYYGSMATEKNMIGITGTNARPSIAPTFSVENMLGTNPLTFGIPTDEEFPFLLDCATSVSQRGKIEYYSRIGENIPPGWVIGRDGKTRTDTDQILKDLISGDAALVPLGGIGEEGGGYKGYGYATVVEILSSALQNGGFLKQLSGYDEFGNKAPYNLGHFFIAINVESFINVDIFKKIAGSILKELRNSEKMPGMEKIYTAGEKEYIAYKERKANGIPVGEVLRKQINEISHECGIIMEGI